MARPWFRARPISFVALIALLGLTGCVYERPGYGGYSDGGGQYYGDGQYYDNGGQYYGYGGGGYYSNGSGNGDGYRYHDYHDYGYGNRPYGYRYSQPQYGYPYGNRHGGDYCRYHRCNWDDDD